MEAYFDFIFSKRYFHLVALKTTPYYSLENFWKDSSIILEKKKLPIFEDKQFIIEQRRMITDNEYYDGEKLNYSVNGDYKAPFHYDIFGIEIKKDKIFIVGFPFRSMAKDVFSTLLNNSRIKSAIKFVTPLLSKLLKETDGSDYNDSPFLCYPTSLGLSLSDDDNIHVASLGGDRPLQSPIYNKVFSPLVQKDKCSLEKCSLKCQILDVKNSDYPKTNSVIHLTENGNFKLYVHGTANNIFTIPYAFKILRSIKCLDYTDVNPLIHNDD